MSTDYEFDDGPVPSDFQCSIIREARDTVTQDIGFRDALSGIRTGRWAKPVEAVRLAYAAGGKEAAAGPKKLLPGVLFSGTFSRRSSEALTKPSGLICADLDGLNETVGTWFEQVAADPHTLACFRSPSGTGLKVILRIDPAKPHLESFHAAEHYMLERFGLQIDEKCSDVSRICFVSHDPELFAADDAPVLPYPPSAPKVVKEFTLPPRAGSDLSPGDDFNLRGGPSVPALLEAHGWTHLRGKYWCRPGKTGDVSASWEHYPNTLHVFSSAPETGFPSDRKGFDPFAIYAHLECQGDFSAAARELGKKGYGAMPKMKPQNTRHPEKTAAEPPAAKVIAAVNPPGPDAAGLIGRPLGDFNLPTKGDPNVLIGNRWLSRGDIFILASTSGMGKSSLSIQAAVTWGLGQPLFGGFLPHKPLRSLIIQSEDGEGDIAEVRLSLEHAMKLTQEQRATVNQNVIIVTDRVHRGLSFRAELARQLAIHQPDLVWINPLLAFLGGDVNDSTDVGAFLREQLNSLNEPAKFAYGIVHHTAKPPKEKAQRQWNEVMYEMAGSADLTNAARAIIALQATQTPGEFKLIAAKRGIRAGLTRPVSQGVGFRQEPVSTIRVHHSKERMQVNGNDIAVIHWERGEDVIEETQDQKCAIKSSAFVAKFGNKIPSTASTAQPIAMIHRNVKDMTELTYNGFKKAILRAYDNGVVGMTEKTGVGPCFYIIQNNGI